MIDIRSIILAPTKRFGVYIMHIARNHCIGNLIKGNTVSLTNANVGSIAPIDRLNCGQFGELPLHKDYCSSQNR